MSIVSYTGLPGSGKSYGVVENVVIPALKAGRHIVTNMPLERDKLLAFCGSGEITFIDSNADVAKLVQMGSDMPGVYFVLDECWRYWPAGKLPNQIPEAEKEFFAMHRHRVGEDGMSTEIVLVTQDLSQISGFVRALVEQTFRVTKLTAIGSKDRYRVDIYEGAVTGPKPPPSRRLREMFGRYRPEIYALYRSHTQSKAAAPGEEAKADTRGNLLKGWRIKIAIASLVAVPFVLSGAGCAMARFKQKITGHAGAAGGSGEPPAPATPAGQPLPPPKPPEPHDSTQWRFAGSIVIDGQEWFLIDGERGTKLLPPELCKRDLVGDWSCTFGNQVVTRFTGPTPSAVAQVISSAASLAGP